LKHKNKHISFSKRTTNQALSILDSIRLESPKHESNRTCIAQHARDLFIIIIIILKKIVKSILRVFWFILEIKTLKTWHVTVSPWKKTYPANPAIHFCPVNFSLLVSFLPRYHHLFLIYLNCFSIIICM
jgi:hypothetical protein